MSKVTRIISSSNLNKRKYDELCKQATLLGKVRKEVWQRYGSINGVGKHHREIRDEWVKNRDFFPLPEKAWKETLRDAMHDIKLYEESTKKKVKTAIFAHTNDPQEQKRLCGLLKGNKWVSDKYLSRMMRKYKKHGRSEVKNQIILEQGVCGQFTGKDGNTWLKIPTFTRGKPLAIPLNSKIYLKGCLRLILKDGIVNVHYTIDSTHDKKCGDLVIGVDQGYSEAFADSRGNFYGQNLGKLLTTSSDKLNKKGKVRNKLFQLLKKKPHKAKNILKYNLGKKKLERTVLLKKKQIRSIAFQSVHKIVDLAKEVRAEDLSRPFKRNSERGRTYNRRMSSWTRKVLAEALKTVTKARCSRLRLVNSAYTSQIDSRTRMLEGKRVGDKFYHANGDVTHAGTNAAVNIEHRADDADISLYMPHQTVKKILLDRLAACGGVSKKSSCNRPSRTRVARTKVISTESELPENLTDLIRYDQI
jgi:hypothetical protein